MMDRFVMGVYLPTANHTLITDKHSGIETKLRDGTGEARTERAGVENASSHNGENLAWSQD